ncbi:DUF1624 domain-containing protein [Ideonella azotifigens]|uniref:Heparan-alpha-glucosaminide N-acetyltransferase catalytic domain-containing protein n=1 Tax=Ideonella azotifigens TaxID=513160 RepID=A0ABN1K4E8_9BURK|nr:heparan-alpha-glucosaminide N-acetyltransferase [Ideonella azotifigens]MCD2344328.1 DUF1624 domain-containing protein [Ideonella azotifigens]
MPPETSPEPAVATRPRGERFDRLDALRGVAILWMASFHFCFDLNHYNLLTPHQRFLSDPFWTTQRTLIVTLFLSCAGLGQAVALAAGQGWPRFWRRWAQVAGCAALVSAGSALMFPHSWISFGVLHGIAAMLLLTRLLAPALMRRGAAGLWALAGLGVVALALPRVWQSPLLNGRWLNWTGLVSELPFTEDYVPVLPWLGVMLLGVAAGLWLLAHRRHWLSGAVPPPLQPLAVLGRWSLSFYMVHQPVLIGGVMAWVAFSQW